jgi:hypothetical protein
LRRLPVCRGSSVSGIAAFVSDFPGASFVGIAADEEVPADHLEKPCGLFGRTLAGSRGSIAAPLKPRFGRLSGYRYPPSTTPKPWLASLPAPSLARSAGPASLPFLAFLSGRPFDPLSASLRSPYRGRPGDPFAERIAALAFRRRFACLSAEA